MLLSSLENVVPTREAFGLPTVCVCVCAFVCAFLFYLKDTLCVRGRRDLRAPALCRVCLHLTELNENAWAAPKTKLVCRPE